MLQDIQEAQRIISKKATNNDPCICCSHIVSKSLVIRMNVFCFYVTGSNCSSFKDHHLIIILERLWSHLKDTHLLCWCQCPKEDNTKSQIIGTKILLAQSFHCKMLQATVRHAELYLHRHRNVPIVRVSILCAMLCLARYNTVTLEIAFCLPSTEDPGFCSLQYSNVCTKSTCK